MKKIVVFLLAMLACACCPGKTITVADEAGADFTKIQDAIKASVDGDVIVVSSGRYNENIDFVGKAITVTSSSAIIDGNGIYGSVVTFGNGEGPDSIISGFTITNGNVVYGGGIYCGYNSSPTITNCTLTANSATGAGSGIYCFRNSNPTISDCNIVGNSSSGAGGGISCYLNSSPTITNCNISNNSSSMHRGGGICCDTSCSPIIRHCRITSNWASGDGGIYCYSDSNPTITHCIISGNSGYDGGGVGCTYASPTISNCIIVGNSADQYGGGLDIYYYSNPTISNCTISANSAGVDGGGVYISNNSNPVLTNCIMWGNKDGGGIDLFAQIYVAGGIATVSFCCIQDDNPDDASVPFGAENNNIDDDPVFVRNPDNGGGGWGAVNKDDFGDLHLRRGSSCIDAGDNAAVPKDAADLDGDNDKIEPIPWDLDKNPRFVDDPATADTGSGTPPIVDIGAYETAAQAISGDLDQDWTVDMHDFTSFALSWRSRSGEAGWNPACDISDPADNVIDLRDLAIFAENWLIGVH